MYAGIHGCHARRSREEKGRDIPNYQTLAFINNFRVVKGLDQRESTRSWMRIGYEGMK